MTKYTYLLVNLLAVIVPLAWSFHPRIRFYRQWKFAIPSILLAAALFIAWDIYFTSIGVWAFNQDYVTGLMISGLPLEEWLFFFCIPYACLFTWFCLTRFFDFRWNRGYLRIFTAIFSASLLVIGVLYHDRLYTSAAFISAAVLCILLAFVLKANWIGKAFTVYAILLLPFFIVNGILTGTGLNEPVVWYNDQENLGLRIGTIPVEDIFYGFALFLLNLFLFFSLQSLAKNRFRKMDLGDSLSCPHRDQLQ
ncbi:MAG TPA: lycopene cyclase domain-containing protein [Chitinophagaceae bacterium]